VSPGDPVEYPEVGVYLPRLAGRIGTDASLLPTHREPKGRVGVLVLRSYVLASNSAHYDGVIASLHAQGLDVVPAFASGLDGRAAIESYFMKSGHATVDAVVSLTGFSLVGGPAYNDSKAAQTMLAKLDVPYIAAMPVEFQPLEEWGPSPRGLLPVEATIMVAIPELDGGTGPIVFGGRGGGSETGCTGCERKCTFEGAAGSRNVHSCGERADLLAQRVMKLVMLRTALHIAGITLMFSALAHLPLADAIAIAFVMPNIKCRLQQLNATLTSPYGSGLGAQKLAVCNDTKYSIDRVIDAK
jgi:magnesium chelatase subunit H